MRRKLHLALSLLLVMVSLCACSPIAAADRTDWLNLNPQDITQITITQWPGLFDPIVVTDKNQFTRIVKYLYSLDVSQTDENPSDYLGGGYQLDFLYRDKTKRSIFHSGNMFVMEKDRFTYSIPYEQATQIDPIIVSLLEERDRKNGLRSIQGLVTDAAPANSGLNTYCDVLAKNGKTLRVNIGNAMVWDATGGGSLVVYKGNTVVVYYNEIDDDDVYLAKSAYIIQPQK